MLKSKYCYVWLLLLVLLILHVPTFNRPLSKHHDFTTAVLLINAESWQQAGGGGQFYFTPFLNYQGLNNRILDKGVHVDEFQRHVYLSYGPGWYLLPYAVMYLLKLPYTIVWLQVLNILIGLITVFLLHRLVLLETKSRFIAICGAVSFSFLPITLWYGGNGYVTPFIILPLILGVLLIWRKLARQTVPHYADLIMLFVLGIMLTYFEWVSPFLMGTMSVWAIYQCRVNKAFVWVAVATGLSVLTGIMLVLVQFSAYLGWSQVIAYWQARFIDRSANSTEFGLPAMLVMVGKNLVTGLLPLLLLLVAIVLVKKKNTSIEVKSGWSLWAFASIIIYNLVFLNWSAVHEFAWCPFALLIVIVVSFYCFPLIKLSYLRGLVIGMAVIGLLQYFIINLPGPTNLRGERYDEPAMLGSWIKENIGKDVSIFTNIDNNKIVEYYSKRTFNSTESLEAAKQKAVEWHIKKAVWVEVENNKVRSVIYF